MACQVTAENTSRATRTRTTSHLSAQRPPPGLDNRKAEPLRLIKPPLLHDRRIGHRMARAQWRQSLTRIDSWTLTQLEDVSQGRYSQ